jgi:hypothetical protein
MFAPVPQANPGKSTQVLLTILLLCRADAGGQEARFLVHADQVTHYFSRYLIGACLEDVNHEVYGGPLRKRQMLRRKHLHGRQIGRLRSRRRHLKAPDPRLIF